VRDRILRNPIYRQISSHLAGAHEYMAMEKLLELESSDRFDLIVLDTPPTRDALDFLAAPERMVDALDSSFLQRFAEVVRPTGGLGSRLLVRGVSRALGVMSRITGRELLDQVAAFLTDMGSLLGGFRQRAGAVASAFRSPRFGFLLVCTPEPESSAEALQLLDRLQAEGMALDALIINRQRSRPLAASEGQRLDALRRRLPAWTPERLQHLARGVARAEADAARAAHIDADRAAGIRRHLLGAPTATALGSVPELPANLDSIDALLRIGRALVPKNDSSLRE
jgi:anion-transporting  ArsA/GET3 family ATPase